MPNTVKGPGQHPRRDKSAQKTIVQRSNERPDLEALVTELTEAMTASINYVEAGRRSITMVSGKEASGTSGVLDRAGEQLNRAIAALHRLRQHIG